MIQRKRNRLSKPHFGCRDNSNPKALTTLFLYFKYHPDQQRLKYSVGESIIAEYWDQKAQKARVKALHPEYGDLNDRLSKIAQKAKEIAKNKPLISHEEFKTELDHFLGNRQQVQPRLHPTLYQFIESYIEHEKTKVDAKTTWKKIQSLLNHLKAFAQEKRRPDLDYNDIDWDFKKEFENWCYSPPRNHSQNNMNKNFEVLSSLMREAYNRFYENPAGEKCRFHTNEIPLEKRFGVNRVQTSHHPLSLSELRKLLAFNDLTPTEMKVKDLFLCSAFGGGFRYSDYTRIKKENIIIEDDVELLHLYTSKGDTKKYDTKVVVPILPEFRQLLEKYNYTLPAPLSSQKSNDIIKKVCEKAGLNRIVEDKESVGGNIKLSHKPIWSLVSSHIARYSFITFMLNELGANPAEVGNMTGQSLKVMYGYVQGDKARSAIGFARKNLTGKDHFSV